MSRPIKCDACGYTQDSDAGVSPRMYTLYAVDEEELGCGPSERADICGECLPLGVVEFLEERHQIQAQREKEYLERQGAKAS